MPAPIPKRDRAVFFVGAGVSKALGLPNTAELLECVFELCERSKRWRDTERLAARVEDAFKYFYPDADHEGYRPDVVDFFAALRTYIDVGGGFRGGFLDAAELYRALKFAIAQLLVERVRTADDGLRAGHPYLDSMVQPGNIIVTSNWDLVIERYAQLHNVPLRLSGTATNECVLLKLHGSIDWCMGDRRSRRYPAASFALLTERLFSTSRYRISLPPEPSLRETIVRVRALEAWSRAWGRISSRALDLHMVTMARGKAGDLGPLQQVWRDAYAAMSRARTLEIVGYSLPPDDIEIRTLLRAAIRRGKGPRALTVRNPSPDVHDRVRRYVDRRANSDYRAINSL